MRALAEEFLLRHLDDGAIGGFLLSLYFATVLFTLDALCRWVLGGHCEDLTTWGSRESREIEKTEVDEFEKIPAPPFTPHESLDLSFVLYVFYFCLFNSYDLSY